MFVFSATRSRYLLEQRNNCNCISILTMAGIRSLMDVILNKKASTIIVNVDLVSKSFPTSVFTAVSFTQYELHLFKTCSY